MQQTCIHIYIHIHIHIKTHIHTAPINRSIGQSPRPSVRQPVSQSRQVESYRVGGRGGGVACLHHAARRSFKSPPGDLGRYRCPHCCVAVLMRCCAAGLGAAPVAFAWAFGDGPEVDERVLVDDPWACPRMINSPNLCLVNWLSGGVTGKCCMRQEDKV